jgi:release factor glutamine methyltransferase
MKQATLGGWLQESTRRLTKAGVESPQLSCYLILEEVLRWPRSRLLAHPESVLSLEDGEQAERLLIRRLAHEPMAYILGRREFRDLRLRVTADVLIPRPETEELIDLAWRLAPHASRILDAGTGSGCIALALRPLYPGATIYACDLSRASLVTAKTNDPMCTIHWFQGSWLDAVCRRSLDLVVSNPPYLTDAEMETLEPQVRDYEPRHALAGGADGCVEYRTLIPQAADCLRPGGCLLVEASPSTVPVARSLLEASGFQTIHSHLDLAGRERFVSGYAP